MARKEPVTPVIKSNRSNLNKTKLVQQCVPLSSELGLVILMWVLCFKLVLDV